MYLVLTVSTYLYLVINDKLIWSAPINKVADDYNESSGTIRLLYGKEIMTFQFYTSNPKYTADILKPDSKTVVFIHRLILKLFQKNPTTFNEIQDIKKWIKLELNEK